MEGRLLGSNGAEVRTAIEHEGIGRETLDALVLVKRLSAQIHIRIHAVGILNALPHILEPDEVVESLSLGAGNTGRAHDLETDRRVAEFKFNKWSGRSDNQRKTKVFQDLFKLASNQTSKRRVLYLDGTEQPLQFLRSSKSLDEVLTENAKKRFRTIWGDQFRTVGEYYLAVHHHVEIVDLAGLVPGLIS